jgi:hypothetical protein
MSILNWFNKPKWQSDIEQVRLTAVQHSSNSELKAHLADIVFHDSSDKVKKAALNRIQELSQLQHIAQNHPNKELQLLADKRLSHLLAAISTEQQTDAHLTHAKQLKSNEAKAHLIEHGQSPSLQQAAVEGLSRQGLLGDLLLSAQSLDLQQLILTKIDQASTLKRIQSQLGHKNTSLKETIARKLSKKEPVNPHQVAQNLCQQLEQVVLKNQSIDLNQVEHQWQQLPENDLPETLITRYQGALNTAKMTLDSDYREAFLQQQKQQRQQQLINQLHNQVNEAASMSLTQLQQAENQFQSAQIDLLDKDQQQRWQQLLAELNQHLKTAQQAAQAPTECHTILTELDKQLQHATVTSNKLKQLKKRWQQATKRASDTSDLSALQHKFDDGITRLTDKITATEDRRNQAAEKAVALIETTEAKIKDGQLSEAKTLINQLNEHQKEAGFNHPTIKKHKFDIDQLWQQLKELRQWQQWSHDKVRQQLIEDLQQLVGSGMHPDAVLQKLQQANQQWADLEEMEKLPGDRYSPRNQKQWQAFRSVSQALFEPAQPFFEKRSEQQDQQLEKINQHIKAMQAADLEESAPPVLSQLVKTAVNYLKNLDKLSPKDRGQSAKAIRREMNRINDHLASGYQKAEQNKNALIEQARALSDIEDLSVAIESAKELQKQWPKAGYVSPKTERTLWKKFRRANDLVFNRRQEQQQAQQAEINAHNKQCQAMIKNTRSQLKSCQDIAAIDQLRSQFNSDWQQLAQQGKTPQQAHNKLLQDFAHKRQQLNSQRLTKDIDQWQSIDNLYTQHEQGALSVDELKHTLSDFQARDQALFTDRLQKNTDIDVLLELLIAGEYLTGIETPQAFMEQRMAYQVNVLANRMAGEDSDKQVNQKALNWLQQWCQQPKADSAFIEQHSKRIEKIIKAVTDLALSLKT